VRHLEPVPGEPGTNSLEIEKINFYAQVAGSLGIMPVYLAKASASGKILKSEKEKQTKNT